MTIKFYHIDAFTNALFGGNPAAVCPLDHWLADDLLQSIAIENNLAETAFFVKLKNGHYQLRWFTPEYEIDLCGHATLASAYVLFEEMGYPGNTIVFETLSGVLTVQRHGDYFELDFPARPPVEAELPQVIRKSLNIQPTAIWKARDYLLLYDTEEDIRHIAPNVSIINTINTEPGGIIVTAESQAVDIDFVSRFFTPQAAIFEDPVTGSAHCTLVPFWASRLNKVQLRAHQISARGGELLCALKSDRVAIRGQAVKYLVGIIDV